MVCQIEGKRTTHFTTTGLSLGNTIVWSQRNKSAHPMFDFAHKIAYIAQPPGVVYYFHSSTTGLDWTGLLLLDYWTWQSRATQWFLLFYVFFHVQNFLITKIYGYNCSKFSSKKISYLPTKNRYYHFRSRLSFDFTSHSPPTKKNRLWLQLFKIFLKKKFPTYQKKPS